MSFDGSFLEISAGDCLVESPFQNYPKDEGWFYRTGGGPTVFNRMYNVAVTAMQTLSARYEFARSQDPAIATMQERVASRGRQLGANDVYKFVFEIKKMHPLNLIESFYFQTGVSIYNFTLDEVKKIIDCAAKDFIADAPIVIPINFSGYGLFEPKHVANIIIKDNVVDYYDSQGILSEHKFLKDGKTLLDVLKYCSEKNFTELGDKNFKNIVENPYLHQNDVHNCGVFICYHIYSKIVEKELMGTRKIKGPSLDEIQEFRKVINQMAYENQAVPADTGDYEFSPGEEEISILLHEK